MYDQVSIDVIQDTKPILDLPTLAVRFHQSDVGSICSGKVLAIPVRSFSSVPENALKGQYR